MRVLLLTAFVHPSSRPILAPSRPAVSRRLRRTRWRLAAAGAGADSRPISGDASNSDPQPSQDASASDPNDAPPTAQDDPRPEIAISRLGQPDIMIDPVKNVPASLVDASGALQIDDGSLASETIIPRKLVKRRPDEKRFDVDRLKRQLAAGFDSSLGATLLLTALFATWYWSNTVFNVYNKQVLKVFPFPLTCTVAQFAVAGAAMALVWLSPFKKPPPFNKFLIRAAGPLAVLHAAGFLLTNMSLGKVSVAFTHTVKSTEPFFSVALTPSILGDVPTWGILGSLFPIVAGVALASATEASFNWIGFFSAIGSNLALQSRNVLSKKVMSRGSGEPKKDRNGNNVPISAEEESTLAALDNVNLFSTMSIMACFILAPVCFLYEGIPLLGAAVAPAVTGMSRSRLFKMLIIGGFCRCVDVLSSYMILQKVSPVTHSVGNCVKRAVVIVTSIIFFKTTMSVLNIAGTILALVGVLLYSLVVSACKQNSFGPDAAICRPIYETELELTEGSGI